MDIIKSAKSVNSLICINNDRIKGYELAMDQAIDPDLKITFNEYAHNSVAAKRELLLILKETASPEADHDNTPGTLYPMWTDIASGVAPKDRRIIIDSCLITERLGLKRYNEVLAESIDDFTVDHYKTLYRQYITMKADYQKLLSIQQHTSQT